MKIDVSKCKYCYEYPENDIECNSALEGDNCKKVCYNKDCKWSLCSENEYCEYKVNWYIQQLKAENKKLKNTIKEMEDDLDDWISDVSILYTYDDGKPNNLDELQCCMEHSHEEWSKYKQCIGEIEEICKATICDYPMNKVEKIMKLIKEVKEGE